MFLISVRVSISCDELGDVVRALVFVVL
jgi:hypothetical protein